MKPLLETTAPLYKKRLVRELNNQGGNGFYACLIGHKMRCSAARLKNGVIELRMLGKVAGRAKWMQSVDRDTFEDTNGREIVASRVP